LQGKLNNLTEKSTPVTIIKILCHFSPNLVQCRLTCTYMFFYLLYRHLYNKHKRFLKLNTDQQIIWNLNKKMLRKYSKWTRNKNNAPRMYHSIIWELRQLLHYYSPNYKLHESACSALKAWNCAYRAINFTTMQPQAINNVNRRFIILMCAILR